VLDSSGWGADRWEEKLIEKSIAGGTWPRGAFLQRSDFL
jgi:hypothetical protein